MNGDFSDTLDRLISEAEDSQATAPSAPTPSSAAPDTSNLLGSLLSNPEILSKLPVIMNAANGFLNGGKPHSGGHGSSHHTALLCALKPYLNSDRQRAAEYIINFLRISDALRSIPSAEHKGDGHVQ
jgi:hypothetical protein